MKRNDKRLIDLLSTVNPFGFIVDGHYEIWQLPENCYCMTIAQIYEKSKSGLFDIALFMCRKQGVPTLTEALTLCRRQSDTVIHWENKDRAKNEVRKVLEVLLRVTQVPFEVAYFERAWDRFVRYYFNDNLSTTEIKEKL